MFELSKLRNDIDKIDKYIIDLLRYRKKIVIEISKIKKRNNIDVEDKNREIKVLSKAKDEYEKEILKKVIIESRKLQL